ncbi:FAD-dependent oxidoreductase, partial [Brevibacillus sp. NRRL NRS-603]
YKLVAVEMLKEAGVKLFVHSFVDQVKVEGTEITSVTLTSKSGKYEIKAKVFVDATGDADIAYLSGSPTSKGRDGDGLTQPMTMKFRMRGVDLEQVKQYMLDHPDEFYHKTPFAQLPSIPLTGVQGFYTHWKMSGVPINRDQVLFFTGPESDEVLINCTRVQGLDGTDVEDLTEAEEEGRRQVLFMSEFLKNKVPGFAKASVSAVGTQIGIRETRRIVGEYSLTIEDVVAGRRFPDVIARSGYPVDIHDPSGKGVVAADIEGEGAYDIPYRCLIPPSIDNLLAAGRCISTTHEALATTRLTPSCMATGQAAGTAAAIAFHDKTPPRLIHVAKLQEQLRLANAVLD